MSILVEIRKYVMASGIWSSLLPIAAYVLYGCMALDIINIFVPFYGFIAPLYVIWFWISLVLVLVKGDLSTVSLAFIVSGASYLTSIIYSAVEWESFSQSSFMYLIGTVLLSAFFLIQAKAWPGGKIVFDGSSQFVNQPFGYAAGNAVNSMNTEAARFCPSCGAPMDPSLGILKFCPKCGASL